MLRHLTVLLLIVTTAYAGDLPNPRHNPAVAFPSSERRFYREHFDPSSSVDLWISNRFGLIKPATYRTLNNKLSRLSTSHGLDVGIALDAAYLPEEETQRSGGILSALLGLEEQASDPNEQVGWLLDEAEARAERLRRAWGGLGCLVYVLEESPDEDAQPSVGGGGFNFMFSIGFIPIYSTFGTRTSSAAQNARLLPRYTVHFALSPQLAAGLRGSAKDPAALAERLYEAFFDRMALKASKERLDKALGRLVDVLVEALEAVGPLPPGDVPQPEEDDEAAPAPPPPPQTERQGWAMRLLARVMQKAAGGIIARARMARAGTGIAPKPSERTRSSTPPPGAEQGVGRAQDRYGAQPDAGLVGVVGRFLRGAGRLVFLDMRGWLNPLLFLLTWAFTPRAHQWWRVRVMGRRAPLGRLTRWVKVRFRPPPSQPTGFQPDGDVLLREAPRHRIRILPCGHGFHID
ncbi:hypothetical protein PAPYR_5597 [Paratrimastix pyriformis]|uniref:Uncharacterized protein n=1 Tax=Paratrimastix pyriformis TaxID=342808 RepID=A0ABQ8UHE3_9EUKA|nr:hypothetical protein PAPYR_5597 [Paratrimastix pyriformis]